MDDELEEGEILSDNEPSVPQIKPETNKLNNPSLSSGQKTSGTECLYEDISEDEDDIIVRGPVRCRRFKNAFGRFNLKKKWKHKQYSKNFSQASSYKYESSKYCQDSENSHMRKPQESVGPNIFRLFELYSVFFTPPKVFYDKISVADRVDDVMDEDDSDKLVIDFDVADKNT